MKQQGEPRVSAFKLNAKRGRRKGVEVTYSRQFTDDGGNVFTVDSDKQFFEVLPHADLVGLFQKLSPHYTVLTEREEHDDSTIEADGTIERTSQEYPCGSIIWKDGENYHGVVFHGHKVLKGGYAANSLTRLVKFNQTNSDYQFDDHLYGLSEAIRTEVILLVAGKHAAPAQKTIEFPQGADTPDGGEGEGGGEGDGEEGGED